MQKSLRATSIIESIVVLIIVVTGIVGVYNILIASQRLSNSTADRIEAIQIARDGLEAFTNIRDTNWILFAADYENCWNINNYNNSCVGDSTTVTNRILPFNTWSPATRRWYYVYKNPSNQFELGFHDMPLAQYTYDDITFRGNFTVSTDSNGFYTQSWWTDTLPLYTRYLNIEYQDTDGGWIDERSEDALNITSIVEWYDPASRAPRKVEIDTVLTNWKAKK